MKLRVGIAATALTLVTAAGCAIQPAATVPASDSPSPVVASPSSSATAEATGVVLSSTRIGALKLGEATESEAIAYLNAEFGKKPKRWETVCDGPVGAGSYTPLSWDGLEIEINDQGVVAGWSVNPNDVPDGLSLESGLPFNATVTEVRAVEPAGKVESAAYLAESTLTDWALKVSATDTTFYWQTEGDEPTGPERSVHVDGPTWPKCLETDS